MEAGKLTQSPRYLVVVLLICTIGPGRADGGDIYIGASASADRLNVLYEKVVDNTDPRNVSPNQGQRLRDEASASEVGYTYGFLAGYKLPLSVTGLYVALEGEMLRHGGVAPGRLTGSGTSVGRNQLGEVWPEQWTFGKDSSYGLTARAGAGIPFIGTWVGPSVYGLFGVRRLKGSFASRYTGCATETRCTEPDQFVSGSDNFSETFSGWTVGGGVEKKLGSLAVRGELRFTEYSKTGRVIPFDDLFVSVPLELEPDSMSFGVTLLWYF